MHNRWHEQVCALRCARRWIFERRVARNAQHACGGAGAKIGHCCRDCTPLPCELAAAGILAELHGRVTRVRSTLSAAAKAQSTDVQHLPGCAASKLCTVKGASSSSSAMQLVKLTLAGLQLSRFHFGCCCRLPPCRCASRVLPGAPSCNDGPANTQDCVETAKQLC